jgi:hypothetical protein
VNGDHGQRPELAGRVRYIDSYVRWQMDHPDEVRRMEEEDARQYGMTVPQLHERWERQSRQRLAMSRAARDTDADRQLGAHAYRAAELARDISTHHQQCATCRRGGQLAVGPRGIRRYPCPAEAELFRQLADAQAKGWPG